MHGFSTKGRLTYIKGTLKRQLDGIKARSHRPNCARAFLVRWKKSQLVTVLHKLATVNATPYTLGHPLMIPPTTPKVLSCTK